MADFLDFAQGQVLLIADALIMKQIAGIVHLAGISHRAHLVECGGPGDEVASLHGIVAAACRNQHSALWQVVSLHFHSQSHREIGVVHTDDAPR